MLMYAIQMGFVFFLERPTHKIAVFFIYTSTTRQMLLNIQAPCIFSMSLDVNEPMVTGFFK